MGMRYKVWLRYGTRGQDTREVFREVEAYSGDHALMLVKSMINDYRETFDSNVSLIQETRPDVADNKHKPDLYKASGDLYWEYKLLRAKAREVLTELEYETLRNALMLACNTYTKRYPNRPRCRDRKEATMKLERIFHD